MKRSNFVLETGQIKYEFRNDNKEVYRLDTVLIRENDNTRRIYTDGTASESNQEYTKDFEFNTIDFASATVSTWDGHRVEITYVPSAIHVLVRVKAALFLIDKTNVINAEEGMPAIAIRFMNRIKRLEKSMTDAAAVGSEDEKYYDETRGDTIPQRRFRTY